MGHVSIAEQFLQCFSLPVPPCSRNSVCQADGRGEGAVTERPVKCKQSQGHVTGSKVTGSTWIMFNLLWFHCKINSLLTFLGHLSMLSTKTCHREGIQRLSVNALIQPLGRSETDWTGIGGQGLRGVSSGYLQDMGSTIFVSTFKKFQKKPSRLDWCFINSKKI